MSHFKTAAEKHHNYTESSYLTSSTCEHSERYVQNW